MIVGNVEPFDVCGPLPRGTTALEASAGTGKTFTIAALATRYVAEGKAALSEIMLVTFSRAATAELRERVRERLVSAERELADAGTARCGSDPLLSLLATGSAAEVAARRARLTRAVASFDAATIATTHGFCQQMLAGLGIAGDTDPDAAFVESVDDLVTEVVDDVYLRMFAHAPAGTPAISHDCARRVARDAMHDRQADLIPVDAALGSAAQQRFAIASAVREEVQARKHDRRLLDYDDLLTRLRDALVDDVRGPAALARIRSRYQVVLVDEFQDTDPVQWEILRTAFHGFTTLVLIGDPKQAIYAFRGADLVTYLSAATVATTRRTLARNWRSDGSLLTALQHVFVGAALGSADIVVRPVDAEHAVRRMLGPSPPPPLRLRVVRRPADLAQQRSMAVGVARPLVARDVAADIVAALDGSTSLSVDDEGQRQLTPGDIAVLVRTNDQANLVREQLAAVNVPAVLTGNRSVFATAIAAEWLTLLTAVEQPHRVGLVRAAALTCFVGWTAQQLATADERVVDRLGERVRGWEDVLTGRGMAALLEVITTGERLTERLLARPAGERDLTDLRHIGQALHRAAAEGQLGPAALTQWLQRRIGEAETDFDPPEERSRRLESDADAVQVVTVHSSKGLEFPVVYVPFGWDRWTPATPDPLRLHADDGTRLLHIGGGDAADYREHARRHLEEESGEDLRLLYVALTRAQCQVVTWWAPSNNTPCSPLHRLLFGTFAPGERPPERADVPTDEAVRRRLEGRAATSNGAIVVERVEERPVVRWSPAPSAPAVLDAAGFDRALDAAWRRTSYTGLTAAAHDGAGGARGRGGVDSEPEVPERQDETDLTPGAAPQPDPTGDEESLHAVPSPMAELPTGTAFGTLVHAVLENIDTAAADLRAEVRTRCAEAVSARLASTVDPGALAAALLPVLGTPLGPLAGDARLRDIAPVDRLPELDFELPLAGGDEPRAADGTLTAVADSLQRHLPAADPLAGYADLLRTSGFAHQRLRGYLVGSIDAVLRTASGDGAPRYVVVDYKTNWLGGFGLAGAEPLTAWHYRPAALRRAMARSDYPLQALLYVVALHRFLRWRQPGYDADRHLGGVLYLFLRGMSGPLTPRVDGAPCGVFSWLPPPGLVEELSDVLDGRGR